MKLKNFILIFLFQNLKTFIMKITIVDFVLNIKILTNLKTLIFPYNIIKYNLYFLWTINLI